MQGFHRMEGIILSQYVLTYYIFSFLFFRCNLVATVRRQWLQQQQQLLVIFTLTQTTKTQKKGENIFHLALFSGGVAQDESEFEFGKGMTARVQGLPFVSFNAVRTQLQPRGKSASSNLNSNQ